MTASNVIPLAPGCPSKLEPASAEDFVDPTPFARRLNESAAYQLELAVHGAHCGGCIAKIERVVKAVSGIENVRFNLSTGKLAVSWRGDVGVARRIAETLSRLGYRAAPFDPGTTLNNDDSEGRFLLRCLAAAGFATANIMLLSIAVWAGAGGEMGPATRAMMHWLSAAIALPAVAFAGRPFFRSAFFALRDGRANMDVPISLAVILALGLSIYETANHGRDAFFDAAVMLLFFLLIGRYLDHRLRAKSREAARDLLAFQSTTASLLSADGTLSAVAAADINPGDKILLSPGDRAPVNGVIVEGVSNADFSLVTGESQPVKVARNKKLYAGVLNLSSRLVMEATARVEDSLVADLTRLIEAGQQSKSRYVRIADRAASLYVPVVHSLALATFLGWYWVGDAGLRVAIMNAVAVLIITCPCALGLAAPAVQIVATGRLFKQGVLVKSGDALERLAEVSTFVFDKTGTLTLGRLQLVNKDDIPFQTIEQAAQLCRASRHPLARSVVEAAGAGPVLNDATDVSGKGIEGTIGGEIARFGRADWVGVHASGGWESEAWFKLGERTPVRFVFRDKLRTGVRYTISALRKVGLEVEMLSGDRAAPARRIAEAAGINCWRAEQTPIEKIERLLALKEQGAKVAMVGDGLNDAPALAVAHASLSPGTAADASQAEADFVFQGESIEPVMVAYVVAKQSRRRVLQNFAFAAFYNICAISLAIFGFVTPLIAALAMSGSSIVVTLNALRISTKSTLGD